MPNVISIKAWERREITRIGDLWRRPVGGRDHFDRSDG
jgi:hypothetical protein